MITPGIAEGSREEFLNILAHELRNPLAAIQSTVELMKARGMGPEETLEHLSIVDNQVDAIATLLNDLLDISRIPGSKLKYQKNGGIKFKSHLPVSKIAAHSMVGRKKRKRFEAAKSPSSGNALKVLLADDNETAANSLSELLSLRGYNVEVAYNGAQAIEKARAFRPQIAILDIGMPDIDGYEVARKIRTQKFPCVYVALTGYGQAHDKKKAAAAGFDYHLTKPTGIKEIDALLQRVARV